MQGVSSKSAGSLVNKRKFVSQELDDDLGLNLYQFKFRNHDPQIGRFIEIDPLADKYSDNSTYAYAENKPISGIDLEGLEFWSMVWNVITDPGNAPSHISSYIAEKQSAYSESVRAMARLSTGTSGEVNHPGPSDPIEQQLTKVVGTLQDVNTASQPFQDVLETTNTLGSLTPVGEAGQAIGMLERGMGGILSKNLFTEGMSIGTKGQIGEELTRQLLTKEFNGATILEQVNMKLDGAKTVADFVVVKDKQILGVLNLKLGEQS